MVVDITGTNEVGDNSSKEGKEIREKFESRLNYT